MISMQDMQGLFGIKFSKVFYFLKSNLHYLVAKQNTCKDLKTFDSNTGMH